MIQCRYVSFHENFHPFPIFIIVNIDHLTGFSRADEGHQLPHIQSFHFG